ncbi:MAG: glycosyltransferase family 2 protein [Candidatus Omnitrophica bacterium]|nr:glycosyltransferase family 2 protein [Candidatus Omnitrophota bacterium]
MKPAISVVIITKNEEDHIAECVRSAAWAEEVLVIDDDSTDSTREIAKNNGATVIMRKMDVEGKHRNFAYSRARNPWVLSLDADERISPALKDELTRIVEGSPKENAFSIPIKTYIGTHWIRSGGWYPAPKVRFFRKDKFKYEEVEVHPRVFIDGPCGHLKGDIIHYSYKDFHEFFESLNNQTTLEAKKWFNEKRKINTRGMLRKLCDRFLKAYFLKKGYKDGLVGFAVSYAGGLYQFMSYMKYKEMLRNAQR